MNFDELKLHVSRHIDKTGALKSTAIKLTEVLESHPGRTLQEKCYLIITNRSAIPLTTAGKPLRFLSFRQGYVHLPLPPDMKAFLLNKMIVDGSFNDRAWRNLPIECAEWLSGVTGKVGAEGLYWLVNGLTDYPKRCRCCAGPITKFVSFNEGYTAEFCSTKCSNNSTEVLSKKRDTVRQKYGVEHFQQAAEVKDKIANTFVQRRRNIIDTIRRESEQQGFTVISAPATEFSVSSNMFHLRCEDGHEFRRNLAGWNRWVITCPECSKTRSSYEKDLVRRLRQFYDGEIQTTNRTVIAPLEIDVYLPEIRLGIEINGDYWHSRTDTVTDAHRHLRKTIAAESVGITLLQVNEREWISKSELVLSKVRAKLGRVRRIFARKCKLGVPSFEEAREFLNANHLQGATHYAPIRYGLYEGDNLVAIATYGIPRFNKKYEYELLRFAVLKDTSVVGGFSKLLHHFINERQPKNIISYADRRYSSGNVYQRCGFIELTPSNPNYVYLKGGDVLTRYQCQKHKLSKFLDSFDDSISEAQNMFNNGWRQLHDCGNRVFVYRPNSS